MIKGVQIHGSGKKKKRAVGWAKAVNEHEAFLKKMGVTGKKSNYRPDKPDLSVRKMPKTSAYRSGLIVKCRKGMIWKKEK